jgi:patatin-like phospholipase/acyl hydrolase
MVANFADSEPNNVPPSPARRSSGTLYGLREQLEWQESEFRILSVDGGGIKGILPASILAECEFRFCNGSSAGRYFDMIAGTSTGGIIALGLGIDLTASEIRQLYIDHGAEIFPAKEFSKNRHLASLQRGWDIIRAVRRYRYEREPLERELNRTFGERIFGESCRRLVVPSFDGYTEVNLFKTPHHQDYKIDWRERIVDIALATSAAPTFFFGVQAR